MYRNKWGKMDVGERWGMQPPPETGEEIPGVDVASRGVAPHKKLRRKQETRKMDRAQLRGEGSRPRPATDATHRRTMRRGSDRTLFAATGGSGGEMSGPAATATAMAEEEETSADGKDAGPAVR